MPQFDGRGWPDWVSPDALDGLGEVLAQRCAAIPAIGVTDTNLYTHYWDQQPGRASAHPRIMYLTPGLFHLPDTRTPEALRLMARVIGDTVTEFCLTDTALAQRFQMVMAYTQMNPTIEHCIIRNPHRLALGQFATAIDEAGARHAAYEDQRDLARTEHRDLDLAAWSGLLSWMGGFLDILDEARRAARAAAHP